MSHFTAGQLQVWTGGIWRGWEPRNGIRTFSNDTRRLAPGACFVALRTEKRDGHDYLADAARAGASAALVERHIPEVSLPQLVVGTGGGGSLAALQRIAAAHRLRLRQPVFGVTGSAGKTSTKDLLAAMLGADGHATQGNLNNFLGLPLTLLQCSPARHRAGVVVEAGMSLPGEMETLARILQPDVGIVTNVLPVHLEGVGTLADIAREKSALLRHIRPGGTAVFPASLLQYADFRNLPARLLPVRFSDVGADGVDAKNGANSPNAAGAENATCTNGMDETDIVAASFFRADSVSGGTFIRLRMPHADFEFQMPECPDGMLRNAALAATAALTAGIPPDRVTDALAAWKASARRGEILWRNERLFYADCYNANPASMLDAARAFDRRTRAAPARIFVLGGMNELGPESAALHRQTGSALPLRPGDILALFGGNAPTFGEGAIAAGLTPSAVRTFSEIEDIRALIATTPSAPVFLKGSRTHALERVLE